MEWSELKARAAEHPNLHRRPAPWRELVLSLRPGAPVMLPDLVKPGGAHPLTTKRRAAVRQAADKIEKGLGRRLLFAEDDDGNTWVGLKPHETKRPVPLYGRRA